MASFYSVSWKEASETPHSSSGLRFSVTNGLTSQLQYPLYRDGVDPQTPSQNKPFVPWFTFVVISSQEWEKYLKPLP